MPSLLENVSITLGKNMMFCEEVGWNWHKSWNLPTITIRYKVKNELFLKKIFVKNRKMLTYFKKKKFWYEILKKND